MSTKAKQTDASASHKKSFEKPNVLSPSGLKEWEKSPAHFIAYKMGVRKQSDAMDLGTLIHKRFLEPDSFSECYVKGEKFDRRTKKGKEGFEAFQKKHEGKTVYSPDDHSILTKLEENSEKVIAVKHNLYQKRNKLSEMKSEVHVEAPITVKGQEITLHGYIDRLFAGEARYTDLKTGNDVSPGKFTRDAYNLKYHWQIAIYNYIVAYNEGVDILDVDATITAFETKPPYNTVVYRVSEEFVMRGWSEVMNALNSYVDWDGEWSPYSRSGEMELDLPAWAK